MHPGDHHRAVLGVLAAEKLAGAMDSVDEIPTLVRDEHPQLSLRSGQPGLDPGAQHLGPGPGPGRNDDCVRIGSAQDGQRLCAGPIGLIDRDEFRHVGGADVGEHTADGGDLTLRVGI